MTHDTDYRHPDTRYLQSDSQSMKGIGIALAVLAAVVAAVLYFGSTAPQSPAPTAVEGTSTQQAPAAPPPVDGAADAPATAPPPALETPAPAQNGTSN